jgi:hypothetical protein
MRTSAMTVALVATLAGTARAGELDLALGLDAADSEWDEDHLGHGTFKLGYRFFRPWFQITYFGKLGYASVDDRMLTHLSLGPEIRPPIPGTRLRPYARAMVVHQHEESRSAVEDQPFQALIGVGDGIRHRGGVGGGLGLELPFVQHRKGDWYASLDLNATYFPDDRGPQRYLAAGLSVGFKWDFDRAAPAQPVEVARAR